MADLLGQKPHDQAIGRWDGGALVAVCAWERLLMAPDRWMSLTLAVHVAHRRRGHAVAVKRELLERADAAGVEVVLSKVRLDNSPMLGLNRRLRATSRLDADAGYFWCSIRV
jgi:ribosomal protein S18 acetylase RimI-like enzyme